MSANVASRRLERSAGVQRVLIVEDEFLIALDVADVVEGMGLTVAGLATGRDKAMALAADADVALVDVNLADGATGPAIARELSERFGITVIFMTANPEQLNGKTDCSLGVLTKPVLPNLIEDTIEYALTSRGGGNAVVPHGLKVFAHTQH